MYVCVCYSLCYPLFFFCCSPPPLLLLPSFLRSFFPSNSALLCCDLVLFNQHQLQLRPVTSFSGTTKGGRTYFCFASTQKEEDTWLTALSQVVYASRGGGMFGTDITTQLQREVSVGAGRGRDGVESQAEPVCAKISSSRPPVLRASRGSIEQRLRCRS